MLYILSQKPQKTTITLFHFIYGRIAHMRNFYEMSRLSQPQQKEEYHLEFVRLAEDYYRVKDLRERRHTQHVAIKSTLLKDVSI